MKSAEEIMQILEAFDLTHSNRDAGELAGCSPNTVALWVTKRDAGELTAPAISRPQLIDEFLPKLEEWMEASQGKVRADVCHDKLVAMGYSGLGRNSSISCGRLMAGAVSSPASRLVTHRATVLGLSLIHI